MAGSISARIGALRALLVSHDLAAFIVPTQDAHQNEYIPDRDKRREFITGFNGSAGTAVIGQQAAWLWTDGRYTLQASLQLDPKLFTIFRAAPDQQSMEAFLVETLGSGARVGVDASTLSMRMAERTLAAFETGGLHLIPLETNLVDQVWGSHRPSPRSDAIFHHPVHGVTTRDKLVQVRNDMMVNEAGAVVVSALDQIAWLLNARGNDIQYNPVFFAHMLITQDQAIAFVDEARVEKQVIDSFDGCVTIMPYEEALPTIKKMSDENKLGRVWVDPNYTSWEMERVLAKSALLKKLSCIALPKALKNHTELEGMRKCHVRDGVALVRFLCWLDNEMAQNKSHTECSVADRLFLFRQEQDMFVDLSFSTISGYGSNGAIIHYSPEPEKCASLASDSLYLVDSGGQYRDGTTDVTRTVHFGTPSPRHQRCFTRVLQGHIALSNAIFPVNTPSSRLDVLARVPLWSEGLDYRHGTGHGVGAFLNVHEGPHLVSYMPRDPDVALMEGMTVTVEPGYYAEGEFGIRIENVTEVVASQHPGFLTLRPMTLAPIQRSLIDVSLLTREEIAWVNDYHDTVREKLTELLEEHEQRWLHVQTQHI